MHETVVKPAKVQVLDGQKKSDSRYDHHLKTIENRGINHC